MRNFIQNIVNIGKIFSNPSKKVSDISLHLILKGYYIIQVETLSGLFIYELYLFWQNPGVGTIWRQNVALFIVCCQFVIVIQSSLNTDNVQFRAALLYSIKQSPSDYLNSNSNANVTILLTPVSPGNSYLTQTYPCSSIIVLLCLNLMLQD